MKDKGLDEIKPSKILALVLYLVPLWWVLGLSPVVYHIAALLYFYFVARKERLSLPLPSVFLLLFLSIYVFSFSLHWMEFPLERGLASVYNLSIWFMGFLLLLGICSDSDFDLDSFLMAGAFLFWFTLGLSFLDLFLYKSSTWLSFSTLIGVFLKAPQIHSSLVGEFFRAKMHIIGRYPLSFLPRVSFFSPYANAFAGLIFGLWGIALTFYWKKGKRLIVHAVNLAALFLILLSMSRASFLIGFLNFVAAEVLILPSLWSALLLAFFFLLMFIAILQGFNPLLLFTRVARGSTEARVETYKEALRFFWSSPLIGIGIKPRFLQGIPLGSHSTYIGLLLKTGFLGFASFLAYGVSLLKISLKGKLPFIGFSLLSLFGWMIFEDLDAPSLTAFVFFSLSGLLIRYNLERRKK